MKGTITVVLCAAVLGAAAASLCQHPATVPSPTPTTASTSSSSPTTLARATTVYQSDFEADSDADRKVWSSYSRQTTPKGNRGYYGPQDKKPVTLSLAELPRHEFVRVSFDLMILGTWDGCLKNDPQATGAADDVGPDSWSMRVVDGATLINSTFSNVWIGGSLDIKQSFPDFAEVAQHEAFTAAKERGSLGFTFAFGDNGGVKDQVDAVYRIKLAFPHDGKVLKLEMASKLPESGGEWWGLDNIKVEALNEATGADLSDKRLAALLEELADKDPAKANAAMWEIIAAGKRGEKLLGGGAATVPAELDAKAIDRWILELDDDDPKVREMASKELAGIALRIEPRLREALSKTTSAEVKVRLGELLRKFPSVPNSVKIRDLRSRRALMILGGKAGDP